MTNEAKCIGAPMFFFKIETILFVNTFLMVNLYILARVVKAYRLKDSVGVLMTVPQKQTHIQSTNLP